MQKITPYFWFDNQAEEAVAFYTSIFKDSKIMSVSHYGEAGSEAARVLEGTVITMTFQLAGEEFMALNGGPYFAFTPALSFFVNCDDREEVEDFGKSSNIGEPF